MERGPGPQVLVEDKQDVSRGTLPSVTASITMVREPKRGGAKRYIAGGDQLISLFSFTKLLGNLNCEYQIQCQFFFDGE